MTPTANLASTDGGADGSAVPAAEAGPFVLNLCSSTTPMALAQVELPELKRFTFFVSRRFEEGRERFRLHMGYFASQAEAEEWLSLVRDIYPGAWAGEAPGKKLRARAAEAAAVQAGHAVGPQKTAAAPAPTVPTPPAPSVTKPQSSKPAAPPSEVPTLVPTLQPPGAAPAKARAAASPAAADRAAAPQAAKPTPQPSKAVQPPAKSAAQPPKSAPQPPQAAAKRPATPAQAQRPAPPAPARGPAPSPASRVATAAARASAQIQTARPAPAASGSPAQNPAARPAAARAAAAPSMARPSSTGTAPVGAQARAAARPVPGKPAASAAGAPGVPARPAAAAAQKSIPQAARPQQPAAKKPLFGDSNVKEVLAALDGHGDATGETRVMPAPVLEADTADDSSLTDTQVLRFLETRREEGAGAPAQAVLQADAAAESGISLLKPDDTGTRRALKEAVSHNDPVSFAVQLQWSVQPVELDKVPPLAIFSAYTLYSVEGSREGRRWYGLRLGFFNDAISAKQVAYYVRSEFNAVAVVPVSPQERERATEDNQRFAGAAAARKRRAAEDNEFKLIDSEDGPPAAPRGPAPAAASAAQAAAKGAQAPAAKPAAAAANPRAAVAQPTAARDAQSATKVGARERRTPQTLEETLEILGANELAIDNGSRESLSDTGVRHLRVQVQKNTPFSRLLERLSERVRKA
ncbi:MAG TPA: hypothetical protein VMU52_04245 [Steroidobacteraceae bacterium]|nr:hypothetical protein [Steroidobacteraceae bacterium]